MCRSGFIFAFRIGSGPSLETSEAWASKAKAQAIRASKRASIASRAAATRSTRESVPNSGPMKIAARRSVSPSMNRPSAPTYSPGHGLSAVKWIVSRFSA